MHNSYIVCHGFTIVDGIMFAHGNVIVGIKIKF